MSQPNGMKSISKTLFYEMTDYFLVLFWVWPTLLASKVEILSKVENIPKYNDRKIIGHFKK